MVPRSPEIMEFHDRWLAQSDWGGTSPESAEGAWLYVELNHRCNCLLWKEEDQARRRNVPDAEIVANKRAIDARNQNATAQFNGNVVAELVSAIQTADGSLIFGDIEGVINTGPRAGVVIGNGSLPVSILTWILLDDPAEIEKATGMKFAAK